MVVSFLFQMDFTEAVRTECNSDDFRSIDGTVKDLKKHQFLWNGSLAFTTWKPCSVTSGWQQY